MGRYVSSFSGRVSAHRVGFSLSAWAVSEFNICFTQEVPSPQMIFLQDTGNKQCQGFTWNQPGAGGTQPHREQRLLFHNV